MSSSAVNINDTFFDSSYQDVWKELIPQGLTEAECDFIEDVCSLSNGESVLDLMCGYGRHSIELAKRGLKITAVDNLASYIESVKDNAERDKLSIKALNDSVLQADFGSDFSAAICMGNSFNFFAKPEALRLVKKVSECLRSKGFFLINTWMISEIVFKYFRDKDWHYAGDYKCILDYELKFFPTRIESKQTIISPLGTSETLPGIDFIYSIDQLQDMLTANDLSIIGLYSTPRKRKFLLGDSKVYIVAQKLV